MTSQLITLPKHGNLQVRVHDRHEMKRGHTSRRLRSLASATTATAFDWSQGQKMVVPDYGNVQTPSETGYGDCMVCESLNQIGAWTLNAQGTESQTTRAAAIAWYLKLAGGQDVGLNEGEITAGMQAGFPGEPNWKTLDHLDIDPTNVEMASQAGSDYGGWNLMLSLTPRWANDFEPGTTWDVPVNPDPMMGHSVAILGYDPVKAAWIIATWQAWAYITPAALGQSDPTAYVSWCDLWFNPEGLAPNGKTRSTLAPQWHAQGGIVIPALTPVNPPAPPVVVPPVVVTPPPTPVNPPDPAPVMVPQRPELTGNGIYQASQLVRKIVNGEADSKTKMAMASLLTAAAVQCGNYYYASAPIPDQTAIPVGQAAAPPLSTPTPGQPLSGAKPKSWTAEDVMATQEMTEAAGFMSSDAVSKHAAMELVAQLLNRVTGAQ